MRELVFQAEAEIELLDAIRHYEQEKPGLGDEFLAGVRILAARLLDYPRSGSPLFRDVRRARVRRFAYQLIYRDRADALIIVAVMHLRRKPGYWKNRL
ncbi:MAG TPA: plasmid stabilization protein [Acidobacteria bacterium]|nr:plasmid stabilization protein [Acidobacteriota bacterium]